jgi:soluble lytic murein transglycosylase-like protein
MTPYQAATLQQQKAALQAERDGVAGLWGNTAPAAPAAPVAAPGAAPAPAAGPAVAGVPAELMPHFEEASRQTGIPVPLLIAQAKQESGFNPNATGSAGEVGIMQIKPSTAQQPGFGVAGVDPASLRDPRANILFGAQYLAARNKGVDWNDPAQRDRGLAVYNGGGDPNYAANVTRNLPQPTPAGGVAARTGGTDVAGPGVAAAPGGLALDPPGTPEWARGTTAEDQARLRAMNGRA